MLISDKFRDECGVVAIHTHPEAEKLAYLGLHALQHRGQESAGIVTSDGERLRQHKSMGLVADIFSEEVLASLRGRLAIGHTRYSTAGDTAVLVHLIALSREQTLPDAIADALQRVEGAFSVVMISRDRIFAARDPRGFRPLAMGRIPAV